MAIFGKLSEKNNNFLGGLFKNIINYFNSEDSKPGENKFIGLARVLMEYYVSVEKMFNAFNYYYNYHASSFSLRAFIVRSFGLLAKIFKNYFLLGIKLLIFPSLYAKYVAILLEVINEMTALSAEVKHISFFNENEIYEYLKKQWNFRNLEEAKDFDKTHLKEIVQSAYCQPALDLFKELQELSTTLRNMSNLYNKNISSNNGNNKFDDPLGLISHN